MLRLRISASLLFALLLQRFSVPVECLGKGKLANDVSLEPTNVVVTFPSEPCGDSALVEWNPPSKGFLVESYRVICEASDLSDRVIEIVDGDTAEVEVGPLQLDSIYSCLVASRSKLGTSQPVASEPFSTKEYDEYFTNKFFLSITSRIIAVCLCYQSFALWFLRLQRLSIPTKECCCFFLF